ncbi:MAG: UbiD family decarboxylase [Deltaproteobacteria bacterium]|nr:UbiD family decarboxylase [Candidatus Anaeroferrophillacea bacterium]
MGYRNLQECIVDLERAGRLRRIGVPLDPHLEVGAIQRRVYRAGGPALLFTRPNGCAFPLLGNLFGTLERTRFIFRDALPVIECLVRAKIDPREFLKRPANLARLLSGMLHLLPRFGARGPVLGCRGAVSDLPRLVSWPADGGPFITLPQVYSEGPEQPGWRHANLGMYRIQIAGNDYVPDREVGLHYQIHRGIGVHHQAAAARGEALRVNVFVGGPPALAVAAVMPLPEGMPELAFAGLLGGRRMKMVRRGDGLPIPAEADFCIVGSIAPHKTKPEGPFGDHLGYYSLVHDFPVLDVEAVYHRHDAVWPFTTVGRPPQEDTSFGAFIHELTGALIPGELPGVRAVNAVDAAGVHPLLLAVGSERYTPYAAEREPEELLTQANRILGTGQLSLAKYLLIIDAVAAPGVEINDVEGYIGQVLRRVDWRRDLHFQTRTTIDTLDYSGSGLNRGSKVVIAAAGPPRRELGIEIPAAFGTPNGLPTGFSEPRVALPGVVVLRGPACGAHRPGTDEDLLQLVKMSLPDGFADHFPLLAVVDDSAAAARSLDNLLWQVFTRSDPAADIYGFGAATVARHWGCTGPLVIDARRKPHHAPPLEEDPAVTRRVEELAARGGPLYGLY